MGAKWLKQARIYHIYPTSFFDANGDGIGDLAGIAQKLEEIRQLGFDTIWISPFYKSPFQDGGYDISDYYRVDKRFGSMQDFDDLIAKAKSLGIRVLTDLVIGHTSDRHHWFRQAQRARRNRYSDYYRFTDNCFTTCKNYPSINGISERDGAYMINFFAFQPSLNYGFGTVEESWQMHYTDPRLLPLHEEILNIMRFWIKRGVSGFRIDLASSLIKNDNDGSGLKWIWNKFIGTIKKEFGEDIVFIAEWGNPSFSVGQCGFDSDFLLHENKEYNDLFRNEPYDNIFRYLERGYNYISSKGLGNVEDFTVLAEKIAKQVAQKGYAALPTGNHDLIRISHGKTLEELQVAYALIFTYDMIPILYYGDEVGMSYQNVPTKDGGYMRTGSRVCMQWNTGKNAGFSTSESTYYPAFCEPDRNVETQKKDPDSLWNTVRKLNELRKAHPCLQAGTKTEIVNIQNGGYPFVYRRTEGSERILVALNPSGKSVETAFPVKKILMQVRAEQNGDHLILGKNSFAIGVENV